MSLNPVSKIHCSHCNIYDVPLADKFPPVENILSGISLSNIRITEYRAEQKLQKNVFFTSNFYRYSTCWNKHIVFLPKSPLSISCLSFITGRMILKNMSTIKNFLILFTQFQKLLLPRLFLMESGFSTKTCFPFISAFFSLTYNELRQVLEITNSINVFYCQIHQSIFFVVFKVL